MRSLVRFFGFLVCGITLGVSSLHAHQPVMDMAPRWEDGWGVQTRYEFRSSGTTLSGDDETANPFERKREVHKTWVEGVYTFRREARVTFKVPFVKQARTSLVNGKPVRQTGSGLGDMVLGVPLKYYKNHKGWTNNIGFTPSVRLPTGRLAGDYPAGDGSTDVGLSLSYSAENAKFYTLLDTFYWINTDGKKEIEQGDQLGFDGNFGYHVYHNKDHEAGLFAMANFEARYEDRGRDRGGSTGGTRLMVGPVVVLYYRNWMVRGEWKAPVYENVHGSQISHGDQFDIGIGLTF